MDLELQGKVRENEAISNELQQYEIGVLAGSAAGQAAGKHSGVLSLSAMKMELEQLRKDNSKLQDMLKSTKEYADFGNFVADSGGQAIRLPAAPKEKKSTEDEKKDWVPQDAFSMAHNFRAQHGNDLSADLIN